MAEPAAVGAVDLDDRLAGRARRGQLGAGDRLDAPANVEHCRVLHARVIVRRGEGEVAVHQGQRQQMLQADRSEEHTSELQSLMRISYAVFCLKKKKKKKN